MRALDADWRLGVAATGLDRANKQVLLANGDTVPYDRLLIATGTRARPWFNAAEGALDGVFTLRTCDYAARLQAALKARPGRVLIVGSGFIGSEMASVCCELGLPVGERGPARRRAAGRATGRGDRRDRRQDAARRRGRPAHRRVGRGARGRRRRACGALGSPTGLPSTSTWWWRRWGRSETVQRLDGAGLATGFWGVGCDAGCRAFDINGVVTDTIFVAGDIARAPHVLYEYEFLSLEHWDNAVSGAEVAARNMVSLETTRRPHLPLPSFWSGQFGVNIKGVGVCSFGDEIIFTQGSIEDRRFAAAYGRRGRIVGAVTFDHGKWLPYYAAMIERSAPFPPPPPGYDQPKDMQPIPARFPDPRVPTEIPDVVLTGHDPTSRGAEFISKRR